MEIEELLQKSTYLPSWSHNDLVLINEQIEKKRRFEFSQATKTLRHIFMGIVLYDQQINSNPNLSELLKPVISGNIVVFDFYTLHKVVQAEIQKLYYRIIKDSPEYKIANSHFWHHMLLFEEFSEQINNITLRLQEEIKNQRKVRARRSL